MEAERRGEAEYESSHRRQKVCRQDEGAFKHFDDLAYVCDTGATCSATHKRVYRHEAGSVI